jgi:endonuclease-3
MVFFKMKKEDINSIFAIFQNNNPNPFTELEYVNHYTLLVAVVLSAQSTDKGVNKATKALFEKYDSPEKIVALGEDGLKQYVKVIGLYNTKAKNIISLSTLLIKNYNSEVPDNLEELIKLPGVGRKTANVVLSCAYGHSTIPVDTHMIRVSNRIGLSKESNPDKLEQDLLKVIPDIWLKNAHHWIVLHGRYVCKARKPLCQECIINNYCEYYKNANISRDQTKK